MLLRASPRGNRIPVLPMWDVSFVGEKSLACGLNCPRWCVSSMTSADARKPTRSCTLISFYHDDWFLTNVLNVVNNDTSRILLTMTCCISRYCSIHDRGRFVLHYTLQYLCHHAATCIVGINIKYKLTSLIIIVRINGNHLVLSGKWLSPLRDVRGDALNCAHNPSIFILFFSFPLPSLEYCFIYVYFYTFVVFVCIWVSRILDTVCCPRMPDVTYIEDKQTHYTALRAPNIITIYHEQSELVTKSSPLSYDDVSLIVNLFLRYL